MLSNPGKMIEYPGEESPVLAYLARPTASDPRPAVIVIHEIFGLNDQIKGVADRFAAEGYVTLAPHLYSRLGLREVLTPENISTAMDFQFSLDRARMGDAVYIKEEMARLTVDKRETIQKVQPVMFGGGLPREKLVQDLVDAVAFLKKQDYVIPNKIASVGFCFGGSMSINLACQAPLAACVILYGENPHPIELVERITGPVLGLYGAEDLRVNAHLDEFVGAVARYKKDFELKIYSGAAHAFFNETRPEVYREGPARDAWQRILNLFQRTLAAD